MSPTKAFIVAVVTASSALGSAFATAAVLRHSALRVSTQVPLAEEWFEAAPTISPERIHRGRTLFLNSCAHCHGADARGDEGPDLHSLQMSDRYIARTITRGIPHEMPAFGKKLGSDEVDALIAYLHSLE